MEGGELIAAGCAGMAGGELAQRGVGFGERARAQVEFAGKPFDGAVDNAVCVLGFDIAFGDDTKARGLAVDGKGMGDVAEGVLVADDAAFCADFKAPIPDILTDMAARGEAEDLDEVIDGRAIRINRLVSYVDMHRRLRSGIVW